MENEQQHPGVNILARAKYELELEKGVMDDDERVPDEHASKETIESRAKTFPAFLHVLQATPASQQDNVIDSDEVRAPPIHHQLLMLSHILDLQWFGCCDSPIASKLHQASHHTRRAQLRTPGVV